MIDIDGQPLDNQAAGRVTSLEQKYMKYIRIRDTNIITRKYIFPFSKPFQESQKPGYHMIHGISTQVTFPLSLYSAGFKVRVKSASSASAKRNKEMEHGY